MINTTQCCNGLRFMINNTKYYFTQGYLLHNNDNLTKIRILYRNNLSIESLFTSKLRPRHNVLFVNTNVSYGLFQRQRTQYRNYCLNKPNSKLETYMKNINIDILQENFDVTGNSAIFNLLGEKRELEENLAQLESMKEIESNSKNEKEMLELIEEDIKKCTTELKETYEKIVDCLVPKGDFHHCNDVVLEIAPGVGGLEAMLFASNLRDMYFRFLDHKGWDYFVAENDETESGGVRHCSLLVSGPGAYRTLQHEAGVHRVQRVPTTERSGRMHTSTVSVAVLPQPSDVEVNLKDSDLKIETKRASGAGGQHVNTTDSAVRVTHIPTGIVVECQSDRSQIKNKATALKRLQAKIYEKERSQIESNTRSHRKSQVGTSSRSEKIRTYNYRDDRISDHRLSTNLHNIKQFMDGGESLDKLIILLDRRLQDLQLQHFIDNLPT